MTSVIDFEPFRICVLSQTGCVMSTPTVEPFSEAAAFLHKLNADCALVFQHAPVGLALLDRELRYLSVNEILSTWHGIAPAEFAGRPLQGIVSGWHEAVARRFQNTLREEANVAAPNVGEEMRGTETVLIAEDHESTREMARLTLASLGYRVPCAGDGEDALRLCEQNTPDIAVLGVVMPKLGGLTTAQQLLNRFPGLPLIFTSGYSHDHDVRTADLPMASYLQKPYSPTHLGQRVREVLEEGKNTRPTA